MILFPESVDTALTEGEASKDEDDDTHLWDSKSINNEEESTRKDRSQY